MNRRAFTLIEMMIVVCIAAIATALAIPMMSDIDDQRLRSAANLLVADLEYAQSESIAHSDALRVVVFNSTTHSYRVATAATPGIAITHPVDNQPYTVTFGTGRAATLEGVQITGYSLGGDDKLGFRSYGQLDQTAAATITLACGERSLTITIDPITGEASVGAMN